MKRAVRAGVSIPAVSKLMSAFLFRKNEDKQTSKARRRRRQNERRLISVALNRFGLHESRFGLELGSARIVHILSRNYKSVYQLISIRHGVFALYLYRLPTSEHTAEADRIRKSVEKLRSGQSLTTKSVLESQFEWVERLSLSSDIGVHDPIRTLDGSLIFDAQLASKTAGRRCVLVRWSSGKPTTRAAFGEFNEKEVATFGSYAARLHKHSQSYDAPSSFSLPSWDWEYVFGEDAPLWTHGDAFYTSSQMEIFGAASKKIAANLEMLGKGREVYGLIHGDLQPRNLLLRRNVFWPTASRVCAIDFDRSGWGYYFFDLAILLTSLSPYTVSDNLAKRTQNALLKAYLQERPLDNFPIHEHFSDCWVMRRVEMVNRILPRSSASLWGGSNILSWELDFLRNAPEQLERFLESSSSAYF